MPGPGMNNGDGICIVSGARFLVNFDRQEPTLMNRPWIDR